MRQFKEALFLFPKIVMVIPFLPQRFFLLSFLSESEDVRGRMESPKYVRTLLVLSA